MASRRQNLKRKSKDFIFEINENDLSADEEVEDKPTKMQKIDSNVETSEIANPNLETVKLIEENDLVENFKESIKPTTTNKVDASANSEEISLSLLEDKSTDMKIEESILPEVKPTDTNDLFSVIDIDDSDIDLNCSVEVVEKQIPIVEVSDDDILKSSNVTYEEGEILDVFEVVDEVGPTPKKEQYDDCIMNISFKNEEIKKCYENKFLNFLSTFSEFDICSQELCINICKKLAIHEVSSDISAHKTPKKKHKKKKVKKELFVLDTNPSMNNSTAGVRYSSKFIIEDKKPEEENSTKKPLSAQTCFNCGKGHALKDCTIPRDFNKINAARQKFTSNKNKRYHVEEGQKFSHLKPGLISEKLRHALGLKKNELPSYIYGMRVLGYPPGWLEEAKIIHSSLRMFNIDGGKVKNNKERKKGLDPEKIIEYPGFNVPMEKGFYDDYKKYKVTPYSKNLEKQMMLKHYETLCEEGHDSENSDMEFYENEDMSKTCVGKMKKQASWPCNTPSLTDLEKQKRGLINELNASNSNNSKVVIMNDSISPDNDSGHESAKEYQPIISVKESALGTPIIKTASPYSRLPNPDNFTVGVSPVIDFENLPNSTGKYEQMSEVLSKVRSTMKNLDHCKS